MRLYICRPQHGVEVTEHETDESVLKAIRKIPILVSPKNKDVPVYAYLFEVRDQGEIQSRFNIKPS